MVPGGPAVAHARTMRKASSDHLALNVDSESERLVSSTEIEDKGGLLVYAYSINPNISKSITQ